MARPHIIETLAFDVVFAQEADAREHHLRLGDYIAGPGIRTISEVFDELAPKDGVLRLDALEIDLGVGPPDESETQLDHRLREALRHSLRGIAATSLKDAAPSAEPGRSTTPPDVVEPTLASAQGVDFETLWALLHHGRLAWRAAQMRSRDIEALIGRVLDAHGSTLARALRRSTDAPALAERILNQWRGDQISRLLGFLGEPSTGRARSLEPRGADEIRNRLNAAIAPETVFSTETDVFRHGLEAELATAEVAEATWEHLVTHDPSALRRALAHFALAPTWRARFLERLPPGRWPAFLSLWAGPDAAGSILTLLERLRTWRLDGPFRPEQASDAARHALAEAMLDAGDRPLAPTPAARAIIRRIGPVVGLSHGEIARRLSRDWSHAPPGLDHIVDLPGPGDAPGLDPEPWNWVRSQLADGRFPLDRWREARASSEEALRATLARLGASEAWRARFVSALGPGEFREVVSLWAGGEELDAVLTIVETPGLWRASAGPAAAAWSLTLRQLLLDRLLNAPDDRLNLAAFIRAAVGRRSEFAGHSIEATAALVLEAWPSPLVGKVSAVLNDLRVGATAEHPMRPLRFSRAELREGLELALAEGGIADWAWFALMRIEPGWIAARLRTRGRSAVWRRDLAAGLSELQLRRLLSLWLPPSHAVALATLIADVDVWRAENQAKDSGLDLALRAWAVDATLLWDGPELRAVDVVRAMVGEVARRRGLAVDVVGHEIASKLARRDANDMRLSWFADHGATSRDRGGRTSSPVEWLRAWLNEPTPQERPTLARLLAPADVGAARLAGFDNDERRRLVRGLDPASGEAALELVTRLEQAWAVARGLLLGSADARPPDKWRFLLWEILERSGTLDPARLVARWLDVLTEGIGPARARVWRTVLARAVVQSEPASAAVPDQRPHESLAALLAGTMGAGTGSTDGPARLMETPDLARAVLRRRLGNDAWTRRLSESLGTLGPRALIELRALPEDAALVAAILDDAALWRLPDGPTDGAVRRILLSSLAAELARRPATRLFPADMIRVWIAALASANAAPAEATARSLFARWGADPDGDAHGPVLLRMLGVAGGPASRLAPASARVQAELKLLDEMDRDLRAADWPESSWRASVSARPGLVLEKLRAVGLDHRWRAAFARALSAERTEWLLRLWVAAPDVELILTLVEGPSPSPPAAQAQPRPYLALREGLLAYLFEPGRDGIDLARLAGALVAHWAASAMIPERAAARRLLEVWPPGRSTAIPRSILALAVTPERRAGAMDTRGASAGSPSATWSDLDGLLTRVDGQLQQHDPDDSDWAELIALAPDRLSARLREHGGSPIWRAAFVASVSPPQWVETLSLWLPRDDARTLARLTSHSELWSLGSTLPAGELALWAKRRLLETLLDADAESPPGAAAVAADLMREREWLDALPPRTLLRARAVLEAPTGSDSASPDVGPGAPVENALSRTPLAAGRRALERLASEIAGTDRAEPKIPGLQGGAYGDLLRRLAPWDADLALAATDQLNRVWLEIGGPPEAVSEAETCRFLRSYLVEEGRRFSSDVFTRQWFAERMRQTAQLDAADLRARFRDALAAAPLCVAPPRSVHPATTAAETLEPVEPKIVAIAEVQAEAPAADPNIYVGNAGLVLAGPYVPALFERLGLTVEGAFVDDAAAERGVHILQFLVDSSEEPALEHQLPLNKLLCGLDLSEPIGRAFRLTDAERETVEGLLQVMIDRWTIIGRTSRQGLRESFLQRQGVLETQTEIWRLRVEPRAFDMLLDEIPWGFQTLKLPWMKQVLHVDWR